MKCKQLAIPVAFVLLGAALMLPNLGDRSLWSDEAGTALFARTILTHGIPIAFDGVNVTHSSDFNSDLVLVKLQWLPYYMAAGSFGVLGVDAFSARLPFVLMSLGTIAMFWRLAKQLFEEQRAAVVTTAVLVLSTAFLLYSRQCRYYAPCIFFTLLSMCSYPSLSLQNKRSLALFVIAMAGLFHSNYLVFFCVAGAWLADYLIFDRSREKARAGAVAVFMIAALTLPWFVYADGFAQVKGESHGAPPARIAQLFFGYYMKLNWLCLLPAALAVALPLLTYRARQRQRAAWPLRVLGFVVAYLALLAIAGPKPTSNDHIAARYVICLAPACALLVGWIIQRAWSWNAGLGMALLTLHLTTNILTFYAATPRAQQANAHDAIAAPFVRLPLFNYVHEIAHHQPDAYAAVADYLKMHGRDDDMVLAAPYHTAEPLILLTGMRFGARIDQVAFVTGEHEAYPRDKLPDYVYSFDVIPDWIVLFQTPPRMLTAETIVQNAQAKGVQYEAPVTLDIHHQGENVKPDFSYSAQSYHTFTPPAPQSIAQMPIIIKRSR